MLRTATAAVAIVGVLLSGCAEVRDPISPQQAREQVVAAARDMTAALHAEVARANFSYESCNDQGEPPFRGTIRLGLWLPGLPRDEPVEPEPVIQALAGAGWHADSEFVSHATTLRKGDVDVILNVVRAGKGAKRGDHVGADIYGQCRDTFDHRTDRSIMPVDIEDEIQP